MDYDLLNLDSKVYGTHVIKDINEILPDFTCFLLTNYTDQGINEKIVQKFLYRIKLFLQKMIIQRKFLGF